MKSCSCLGIKFFEKKSIKKNKMCEPFTEVDKRAINTIRVVACDMINKANSGHPGAPMGCAPMAHVLFSRFLKCNPNNSQWVTL